MIVGKKKDLKTISREWDEICYHRQTAINEGKDISLTHVIIPAIIEELNAEKHTRVLDVGCGSGFLTNRLKDYSEECIGIDASEKSIMLAQESYQRDGLFFINTAMNDYISEQPFDCCVSNMALMSDPHFSDTLQKINDVIETNGVFFLVITHPCFWARYWGIDNQEWFKYENEIYIEHDFSISFVKSIGKATYIHRPLELYYNAIIHTGFLIEKIKELYPIGRLPEGYTYDYPRFLLFGCRKGPDSI